MLNLDLGEGMPKLTGGQLAVRALQAEGVRLLFGIVGGHTMPISDACLDAGIQLVDTRHEETAAHLAHGWARATGEPGVAFVTAGAGVTNAVTGVANAYAAGAPMVLIGGACPLRQVGMGAFHEIDQVAIMRPITKWSATVLETRRIPEYINTAFRQARSGRPGPAFLDIPADLLRGEVDESEVWFPKPAMRPLGTPANPAAVSAALDLLASARRPLVIAGSGVWWAQAAQDLDRFLSLTSFPVITTQAARGVVPADYPRHFGAARSLAMREADVVLVLGARFNFVLAYGRPPRFNAQAKVIQVDVDAAELGHNRDVDLGIVGDAGEVLCQLIAGAGDRFQGRQDPAWCTGLAEHDGRARSKYEALLRSAATPIHPLRLCQEIDEVLDRNATVIADGGDILSFARLAIKTYEPGRWMDAGAFGCLGEGLGFAMAAKLARPEQQVVAVVGDGAFGLQAMELDTAVRHRIPIVVVVGNNAAWNIEKHTQKLEYGRTSGTDLLPTRYDRLAEVLGCHAEFVELPEQVRPALERAFAAGRPACINVMTDSAAASPDAVRMLGTVPPDQAVVFKS